MFQVKEGKLDITHPDVDRVIVNSMEKELESFSMNDATNFHERVCNIIWTYHNYDKLLHPVTTVSWHDLILAIYPGRTRITVAKMLNLNYVDSVFVFNDRSYVNKFSKDLEEPHHNIVFKPRNMWDGVRPWDICVEDDYANHPQQMADYWNECVKYAESKYDLCLSWVLNGEEVFRYGDPQNPVKKEIYIKDKSEYWKTLTEFLMNDPRKAR